MRFSSGLFLQLSSILLAAAAAYALGALCSEWLHRWILTFPMPSMKSSSYQMVTSSPDGGRLREEFQAILDRNIFNALKTEMPLPPPEPEPKSKVEEAPKEQKEEIEPTRLQIALTGTMVYGKDHSFAFISPQGRLNEYSIYQMGDCFNPQTVRLDKECKEDSVQVIKIGDRRVVILHRGKKQALWMQEAKGGLVAHLEAFAGNTIEFIRSESPLLIDGIGIPDIDVDLTHRHVVVVAEEPCAAADLKALKPFIKEYQPVLVGVGDVIGMLGADGLNASEASFSVHQGQQTATAVATHHQIDFPIAHPSFLIDDGGTVLNRNPMGNRAFIRGLGPNALRSLLLT